VPNKSKLYSKAVFEIFLFSLFVVWLPFKFLAYLLPFLCLAWFIIRMNSGATLLRLAIYLISFVLIIGVYFVFYKIVNEKFIVQNSILSILTYGSFLFLIVLTKKTDVTQEDFIKYIKVIKLFILLESFLGISQVVLFVILHGGNFDSSTWDMAQGTLNPLSFLIPLGNFNNQIYTVNLLSLLLFYTPYAVFQRKGIWVCVLGLLAILAASVWHMFLAFLLAALMITFYFTRTLLRFSSTRVLIVFFVISIFSVTIALQPSNFSLVSYYFGKITSDQSPKTAVTVASVSELPKEFPWVYIIGLGPGQYTSRAGLIGTGRYFGEFKDPKKLLFLTPEVSHAFNEYVYDQWEGVAMNPKKYGNSTMSRPFYSIMSILIEFGYVVFIVILITILIYFVKIKRLYQRRLKENDLLGSLYVLSCGIFVLFLILISLFENYLEVAHAIFLGLVLYKYFYALSKTNVNLRVLN